MSRSRAARLGVMALVVLGVAAFFGLGLHEHLTLDALKENREQLSRFVAENTAAAYAGYFAGYVLVTALSLPGATIMTLAGGAVFGFTPALLLISFASTIGATLACGLARFLLRDWVQGRFGERLARINQGVAREGAFYLFTLRLIPAVPFFVLNLAMGLTPMRLFTFYWVSQLGMLPGTIVYVNAGAQLGRIENLGDVLSPELLGSFVLLGIFPLLVKKIMERVRRARACRAAADR